MARRYNLWNTLPRTARVTHMRRQERWNLSLREAPMPNLRLWLVALAAFVVTCLALDLAMLVKLKEIDAKLTRIERGLTDPLTTVIVGKVDSARTGVHYRLADFDSVKVDLFRQK